METSLPVTNKQTPQFNSHYSEF